MAIRIKHKVNVRIAEDTGMKNLLFGPDNDLAEVTNDGYERQASGNLNIIANANEDVPFGDVDLVMGFYLKLNGDCTITLNGGAEPIAITKPTTSDFAKIFIEAAVTQINILAPADQAIVGTYCVWGSTS